MTRPTLVFQVGLETDASLGDEWFVLDDPVKGQLDNPDYTLAPDTVWVDVSGDVDGDGTVEFRRGRQRRIDEWAGGSGTFRLHNNDRKYDPSNPDGPYFGLLKPLRRVRVHAVLGDGSQLPAFAGYVYDWPVAYGNAGFSSTVPVRLVDSFAVLGPSELDEVAAVDAGDTSGERIQKVLDKNEVQFPATRNIDQGISVFGATTYGGNTLSYLQTATKSELGYLFVSGEGTLTFRDRHSFLNTEPQVVFASPNSSVEGIPFHDVGIDTSTELLFNRIKTSGTSGTEFVAGDAASQQEFLVRALDRTGLFVSSDAEVEDIGQRLLGLHKDPELRVTHVDVQLAGLTTTEQRRVLGLDIGSRVRVAFAPPSAGWYSDTYSDTYGSPIDEDLVVEGVEDRIAAGSWVRTLRTSQADTASYLTLDDPIFGELDNARLGV